MIMAMLASLCGSAEPGCAPCNCALPALTKSARGMILRGMRRSPVLSARSASSVTRDSLATRGAGKAGNDRHRIRCDGNRSAYTIHLGALLVKPDRRMARKRLEI